MVVLAIGRRNRVLEASVAMAVLTGGSVVRMRSLTTELDESSFLTLKVGGVYLLTPLLFDLPRVCAVSLTTPPREDSICSFSVVGSFRPAFSCLGLNRSRPTKKDERVWFRDDILTLDLV